MRRLWVMVLLLAALALPAGARAADPLGLACADQGDGIRLCQGKVKTFDGVPLDANLALPAGSGLPLVVLSHGYGGSKLGYEDMKPWAQRGYAVLAFSARGFGESCGSAASRLADPVGCAQGWVRLDDVRYEARDIQQLAGLLADAGVVDGQKVGVTGGSYGGGVSLDLAVLRDRVMLPDGTLRPWTSPAGRPMSVAGAVPWIPWSDLAYALAPNGRTLDYEVTSPTADLEPFGIVKQSFVAGLFASGQASGYYAPPGVDPDADLTRWFAEINAGEPYGAQERAIAGELAAHHSAYYLDHSRAPAPTLIANGWTDDLFPVDEALRYYNRTRAQYPDAPLALMFLDFGHQRGQNKDADVARFEQRAYAWMDRYVKGDASAPALRGVEALTQTCPKAAPSGGPYEAPTWEALHPGEVGFSSATAIPWSRPAATPPWPAPSIRSPATAPARRRAPRTSPGPRLPPAGRDRRRLYAARGADGDRRPRDGRQLPGAGFAPARRGARRDADPRGAGPLPPHGRRSPGLPAASRRVALRCGTCPQARAPGPRRALRKGVERDLHGGRELARAAPAGA